MLQPLKNLSEDGVAVRAKMPLGTICRRPHFPYQVPKENQGCAKKWEGSSTYMSMAVIAKSCGVLQMQWHPPVLRIHMNVGNCRTFLTHVGDSKQHEYSNDFSSHRHIYANEFIQLWRKMAETISFIRVASYNQAPTKQSHLSGSTWCRYSQRAREE